MFLQPLGREFIIGTKRMDFLPVLFGMIHEFRVHQFMQNQVIDDKQRGFNNLPIE
jgi:hypothetical protein